VSRRAWPPVCRFRSGLYCGLSTYTENSAVQARRLVVDILGGFHLLAGCGLFLLYSF
jgi:hypothetical protein